MRKVVRQLTIGPSKAQIAGGGRAGSDPARAGTDEGEARDIVAAAIDKGSNFVAGPRTLGQSQTCLIALDVSVTLEDMREWTLSCLIPHLRGDCPPWYDLSNGS
jgi:hypothetical protein